MNIRRGAKGPQVMLLQIRLEQAGIDLNVIDGDFGGGTESAVRQFQERERHPVTGVVL